MTGKLDRRRFTTVIGTSATLISFGTPLLAADPVTLRVSTPSAATDPLSVLAQRWGAAVEKGTNGSIKVEVFPNGSLAKQQESIDGLRSGTVDLTIQTTAFVETLAPRVQAIDLPFLFPNRAVAERVLDGPVGRDLSGDLSDKGILNLAWGTAGWRQFEVAPKPIKGPADCRGLRVRIQNAPVYVSMLKAMNATPVPIDNSEVYVALSQKSIDAIEIPPATVLANKYFEVVKYVSLTNHLYNAAPLLMSKQRFDGLTADQKRVILGASKELLGYWRNFYPPVEKDVLTQLQAKGLTVNETDLPAFKTAMAPVYDEYRGKIGAALIDRVLRESK